MNIKDSFDKAVSDLNPRQRFVATSVARNIAAKQSVLFSLPIPSSRFSGIEVSVLGISSDQQFVVTFWGTPDAKEMQFKRRFTTKSISDTVQGWTYRDFSNKKMIYIQIDSESTTLLSNISIVVEGEAY